MPGKNRSAPLRAGTSQLQAAWDAIPTDVALTQADAAWDETIQDQFSDDDVLRIDALGVMLPQLPQPSVLALCATVRSVLIADERWVGAWNWNDASVRVQFLIVQSQVPAILDYLLRTLRRHFRIKAGWDWRAWIRLRQVEGWAWAPIYWAVLMLSDGEAGVERALELLGQNEDTIRSQIRYLRLRYQGFLGAVAKLSRQDGPGDALRREILALKEQNHKAQEQIVILKHEVRDAQNALAALSDRFEEHIRILVEQYRLTIGRFQRDEVLPLPPRRLEGQRVLLVGDPAHRVGYGVLMELYGATMDFVDGMSDHRVAPFQRGVVIIVTSYVKHALVRHIEATVGPGVCIRHMPQAGLAQLQISPVYRGPFKVR